MYAPSQQSTSLYNESDIDSLHVAERVNDEFDKEAHYYINK